MKALRIILISSLIYITHVSAQIGGYALKFDGVDDYLSTSYNTQLNTFTIECWV